MSLTAVDLTAIKLNAANMPARSTWLKDYTYIGTTRLVNSNTKTVLINEFRYTVQGVSGTRVRRCFVVNSHEDTTVKLKPILLVGLPGSSVTPDGGAKDLWSYPAGNPDYEFSWPIEVVRDNNIFAVLIDLPRYGINPYVPANSYDTIIDTVAGIDVALAYINDGSNYRYWTARHGLQTNLIDNLFIGGQSYGANITEFLCGCLTNVEAAYVSGATITKSTLQFSAPANPPDFYITDWPANWDFADMLKASSAKRVMIAFGWNNHGTGLASDYARTSSFWTEASIDAVGNALTTFNSSRFEYNVFTTAPTVQGHEINLPHCRAWFSARINETAIRLNLN